MLVMVLRQLRLKDYIDRSTQSSSQFVLHRYQCPGRTKRGVLKWFQNNGVCSSTFASRLGNPTEEWRKTGWLRCLFRQTFGGGNAKIREPNRTAPLSGNTNIREPSQTAPLSGNAKIREPSQTAPLSGNTNIREQSRTVPQCTARWKRDIPLSGLAGLRSLETWGDNPSLQAAPQPGLLLIGQ